MTISSMGDLATAFALRQRNTEIKMQITKLNEEMSTGVAANISDHLGGSYARLTSVERDMRVLKGFSVTISEAAQFSDIMQVRLDQIAGITSEFTADLIASDASAGAGAQTVLAEEAELHFSTIVESLNSKSAGRNMFSGDATNTNALIQPDLILAEIESVVTAAAPTTAAQVVTAIETWFDDPLGFEAFAYTGGTGSIAPFKMSDTVSVGVDIRANDPAFKDVLSSLATAAISKSTSLALPFEERQDLIPSAAQNLFAAQQQVIGVQSRLGLVQEQVSGWSVRTQTEQIGTEYAKSALLAVDPYETATRLDAAQFQLQSLYTVTARLSQLSLVNYLR